MTGFLQLIGGLREGFEPRPGNYAGVMFRV